MRRFVVLGVFVVALTGCDQLRSVGWHQPSTPVGYGTYTPEPANNGCDEQAVEVVAEVDNAGVPCKAVVP